MGQRRAEKAASESPDASSFRTIGGLWLDHWKIGKSAQHVRATTNRLESNVYPIIGADPITTIEERGAGDLAKRAMQTTGQIFRYAIAHNHAKRNPVADIKPADVLKPTITINVARIDARDFPALLKAIEVYRGKVLTRLAIKLMMLTFPRTSELIGGRWPEIDKKAKRWNIPPERMKKKTPHIIPLSTQALEVLDLLEAVTGDGELMFPGELDRRDTMSNNTILFALYRMGYKGDMTGHGFRGLAATILNENGFDEQHVDLQLAHMKRNKVTAAYNHAKYLKQRTVMMQWWGDYVEAALRGGKLPEAI
jgi:integrase